MKKFNPATAGQNFGDSFEKFEKLNDNTTTTKTTNSQQKLVVDEEKKKIAQMAAEDEVKSKKRIGELETEMKNWRKIREEELRKRRTVDEQAQTQVKSAQETESPLAQPPAKKKRGMLFGLSRRIKSAQEQSAPELSGRRVGG